MRPYLPWQTPVRSCTWPSATCGREDPITNVSGKQVISQLSSPPETAFGLCKGSCKRRASSNNPVHNDSADQKNQITGPRGLWYVQIAGTSAAEVGKRKAMRDPTREPDIASFKQTHEAVTRRHTTSHRNDSQCQWPCAVFLFYALLRFPPATPGSSHPLTSKVASCDVAHVI